uniref:Uncharacterized protein n=1 Tax=Marseillevirus LCMAC201 TaxID=2506605 RepID=A0A481YWF8_9VIRU|nr:MAG: hypothetical protein LCMAC201_05160 [Marseillevirus LCMAC201]
MFVFYTFDNPDYWYYDNMPEKWRWVGTGTTSAIGEKKLEYQREEQFMGDEETKILMYNYLHNYFSNLKEKEIIKKYKIEDTYLP